MVANKFNSGIAFQIAEFLNEGAQGCLRARNKALRTGRNPRALALVSVVNLCEEDRRELREVVDVWLGVEGEWKRFSTAMLTKFGPGAMNPYTNYRVHRDVNGTRILHADEGTSAAQGLMLQLIEDAAPWRLAGRCANCGRYMVRERKREKKYCRAACKTATPREDKRAKVKARKVEHIQAAIAEWERGPRQEPLIGFILKEATSRWGDDIETLPWRGIATNEDTSVTKTYLTQRIKDGSITLPN